MNATTLFAPFLLATAALVGGACAEDPVVDPAVTASSPIMLDGHADEWPDGSVAVADTDWLYLRFPTDGSFTLQGGQVSSALQLDVDGRPQTGREEGGLGVDLEVLFSPPSDRRPEPRAGVEVRAVGENAIHEVVKHATIGLAFAPTYAATEYELRIARRTTLKEPVGSRWHSSKVIRGRFVQRDADGAVVEEVPFTVDLPKSAPPPSPTAELPSRHEGTVRVASWNIERASPRENPKPFARILTALDPDVVLVQEWWETSENELLAWFSAHLPARTPWRAITFGELGCAVLTKLPAVSTLAAPLDPLEKVGDRDKRPVRFVGAAIETPIGPLVCGSLHLKARGFAGSWEDDLRVIEAETIHAHLREFAAERPDIALVIAGDWNLVGSDRPLETLRAGLDRDGSALEDVIAPVLGDRSLHTWTKADASFTPGRLDWLVLSDAVLEANGAFVLDTATLSEEALKNADLRRDDSRASDHLPLVVDVGLVTGTSGS